MTPARRAELRALVLEAIATRGKASLRDLELDIVAGRRALAEILDELHRDQLIVQVAGYRGRMAWAIASAVERGQAVPSGVAAGVVPESAPTVELVSDETVTDFQAELRAKGIPEDMIADWSKRLVRELARVTETTTRQTYMVGAILDSLGIAVDGPEAERVFASVRDLPHSQTDAVILAHVSAALVAIGYERFAVPDIDSLEPN